MTDLHERLHTAITAQLEASRRLLRYAQENSLSVADPKMLGMHVPGWHEWPDVEKLAEWSIRACERDLAVLERHAPNPRTALITCSGHPRSRLDDSRYPCPEITSLATVYGLEET